MAAIRQYKEILQTLGSLASSHMIVGGQRHISQWGKGIESRHQPVHTSANKNFQLARLCRRNDHATLYQDFHRRRLRAGHDRRHCADRAAARPRGNASASAVADRAGSGPRGRCGNWRIRYYGSGPAVVLIGEVWARVAAQAARRVRKASQSA